jgi:serine phosphatase RsbU (regulator of sigma subunit)
MVTVAKNEYDDGSAGLDGSAHRGHVCSPAHFIGLARVKQIVCDTDPNSHDVVERVVSEIKRHEGGRKQRDDQAVLALKVQQ